MNNKSSEAVTQRFFAQKSLFLKEKFHSYAFFVNFVTRYRFKNRKAL